MMLQMSRPAVEERLVVVVVANCHCLYSTRKAFVAADDAARRPLTEEGLLLWSSLHH